MIEFDDHDDELYSPVSLREAQNLMATLPVLCAHFSLDISKW